MIEANAEISLQGPKRSHDIRLDTRINLEPPAAIVVRGWVQRERSDHQIAERQIPEKTVAKMRTNQELQAWIFKNTISEFPE